ncbi:MAG: hypothetical protein NZM26_02065 [Patescibacteria group bacterium]|nr:hypothetical protein [Patescibacteria group bacterium]
MNTEKQGGGISKQERIIDAITDCYRLLEHASNRFILCWSPFFLWQLSKNIEIDNKDVFHVLLGLSSIYSLRYAWQETTGMIEEDPNSIISRFIQALQKAYKAYKIAINRD